MVMVTGCVQGFGCVSLFQKAAAWVEDERLIDDFRRFCIVYPYSISQVRLMLLGFQGLGL